MTRHGGAIGLAVAEKIDRRDVWRVRTDMQPDTDGESGEQKGVTFIEHEFPYKPSMQEVKDFVYGVINAKTDQKILSGFVWEGINVWLSTENQFNYSEAQRMGIVPVVFKLGEKDGEPVYHTFTSTEELDDFYTKAVAYIQQTLASGWKEKDGFDFTPYEEALGLNDVEG